MQKILMKYVTPGVSLVSVYFYGQSWPELVATSLRRVKCIVWSQALSSRSQA